MYISPFSAELSFSGPVLAFLLGAILAIGIGTILWSTLSQRGSTAVMHSFAKRLGVKQESPAAESATKTIRRRWMFSQSAWVIGFAGAVWAFIWSNGNLAILVACAAGVLLLSEVGSALAALTEPKQPQGDEPRLTRLTAVTLRSYVPRWVVRSAAICAVSTAVIAAVIAILQGTTSLRGNPILTVVISAAAIATWYGLQSLAVRLVNTAQPARTEDELKWSDALRADALLSYFQLVPLMSALLTFVLVILTTTSITPNGAHWEISSIGPVLLLLAGGAMSATSIAPYISGKTHKHYLQTLWVKQEVAP